MAQRSSGAARRRARLTQGIDWPRDVDMACSGVQAPRFLPAVAVTLLNAALTLLVIPGYSRWAATRGPVLWIGYKPGYVAAVATYQTIRQAGTVVRWEDDQPRFERLKRSPLSVFYMPVAISGRRVLVPVSDADRLEEMLAPRR